MSLACSASRAAKAYRPCFTPETASEIFVRAEITYPSFPSTLDALFGAGRRASVVVQRLFAFRCPQPFPSKKLKSIFESKWYHIATGEKSLFLRGTQKLGPRVVFPRWTRSFGWVTRHLGWFASARFFSPVGLPPKAQNDFSILVIQSIAKGGSRLKPLFHARKR